MRRFTKWLYWAIGILVLIVLIVTIGYWQSRHTRTPIVMTTGVRGGAYYSLGQRYKDIFARSDVELHLTPSHGSVENLKRLNDPNSGVSIGFVQGGLTSEDLSPDLVSLGTVFYEPVWFFYRGGAQIVRLDALRGKKISIGPEGSGTRKIALDLLSMNGIDSKSSDLFSYSAVESGEKLIGRELDAAVMVASWETPIVHRLVADPNIHLVNLERADAYVALFPFLNRLELPTGVGDLATNRPPEDIHLIASKTSLVIRKDLRPAIQYLLLSAASEIHSGPGVFKKSGQFPAAEQVDIPLSTEAQQFYKTGVPFLQRYLPFWLAAISTSLIVILVPIVGLLFPLLRLAPAIYGWGMQRRIFRLYGEVKMIEIEMESEKGKSPAELLNQLDDLEERAIHTKVATGYAPLIYNLRHHINLVRTRLQQHCSA